MRRALRAGMTLAVALALCGLLQAADWIYCIKCGKKIPPDAVYCPYCGHKVGAPLKDEKPKFKPRRPKQPPLYEQIDEADRYYELAETKRTAVTTHLPFLKKRRFNEALDLYLAILEKWPTSDKCELAAYRAAQIYSSLFFRDWEQAIKYYRMVLEINPATTLPARLRIAQLTEEGIHDYEGALALYQDTMENARVQSERERAAREKAQLEEKLRKSQERMAEEQ